MATSQDLVNADLNLATLDGVVTSNAVSVNDRIGQPKLTIAEIQRRSEAAVAAAGFYPVAGSFELGGTITERNQVLQRTTPPEAYFSWGGAIPPGGLIIPPSSTVAGTGGEGVTAWTNRNDATLAAALMDGSANIGGTTALILASRSSYTKNVASDYGAVAGLGVDATAAFQAMHDALGYIAIPATEVPFEIGAIVSTRPLIMFELNGVAKIKAIANANPFIVTTTHPNSYISGNVYFDCNSTGRGAVFVNTGADDTHVDLWADNVTANLGATGILAGLAVSGAQRVHYSFKGKNFSNTGSINESLPRAVSIQDGADAHRGKFIHAEDFDCSTFLCFSGTGTLDDLKTTNCGDNGIYGGGNCNLTVGNMQYSGSEESVVAISGARVRVDSLSVSGAASWICGVDNADGISIGNLHIESDSTGASSIAGIARTRPGNTSSNFIEIESISGSILANRLIGIDAANGVLKRFRMTHVNAEFIYKSDIIGPLTSWGDMRGVTEQFNLSDWNLTIIPFAGSTLTSSEMFYIEPPGAGTSELSFWQNLNISMPNGGVFRGRAFRQKIRRKGVSAQVNIGPYAREVQYAFTNMISAVPTSADGYFEAGEVYSIIGALSAPFVARCTVSGNPGTWGTV